MPSRHHIRDKLSAGRTLSVEIMPPRTPEAEGNLGALLAELGEHALSFVSVTYGAGGSTRDRTAAIVSQLINESPCTPMAHLTCITHAKADIESILTTYRDAGLANILALYGDPPANKFPFVPTDDFENAISLVQFAREIADFSIGVAMHPEGHPRAGSRKADRVHQAEKLKHADFGITQFFFDVDHYRSFVDDLNELGVSRPVIPGVVAPLNVDQLSRLSELSGATIPPWVEGRLTAVHRREETWREGVAIATELTERLLDAGAPGVHLYTMNNLAVTQALLDNVMGLLGWKGDIGHE